MSYEKVAGSPNKIRFYYITDNVFDRVSRITSFKAASVKDKSGLAEFDKLHIADDEKDQFRDYLKEGMLEVFSGCFKIIASTGITHDSDLILLDSRVLTEETIQWPANHIVLPGAVVGHRYTIDTAGTTDFTLIGATDSVPGTAFVATGVGTGSGTVYATLIASYIDIIDNLQYRIINLDLMDTKIENALVHFILKEWYFLKGLDEETKIHMAKYKELFGRVIDLSLPLRQPI